jgi:ABC-2 type transport system permease protein
MATEQTSAATYFEAHRAGFFRNVFALSVRSIRALPRDPETFIPAFFIPAFFYIVNIGIFQDFVGDFAGINYREFQLPVAILFAVTGLSQAVHLVLDIQNGYFDRLALAPINRFATIMGLIVADVVLTFVVSIPVFILGLAFGVDFDTGILGIFMILLITIAWTFVYNGIGYGIALKTGNPTIVNSSFILFLPVLFLSTVFVPLESLTPTLEAIARFNPTTYVLEGLRSLLSPNWDWAAIGYAFLSIFIVGVFTMAFALWALNARLRRS